MNKERPVEGPSGHTRPHVSYLPRSPAVCKRRYVQKSGLLIRSLRWVLKNVLRTPRNIKNSPVYLHHRGWKGAPLSMLGATRCNPPVLFFPEDTLRLR